MHMKNSDYLPVREFSLNENSKRLTNFPNSGGMLPDTNNVVNHFRYFEFQNLNRGVLITR